jgi:hypothetical protein
MHLELLGQAHNDIPPDTAVHTPAVDKHERRAFA